MDDLALQNNVCDRLTTLAGGRASWLVRADHTPAALSALGILSPGDRLVVFADDFEEAFADGVDGAEVRFVASPDSCEFEFASEGGARSVFWFVSSIGGRGLRVPDLRHLGASARAAGALLLVDNTVASFYGCSPLALGAAVSLEALDRVGGGRLPQKMVCATVARSVRKRHRVDAGAQHTFELLGRTDVSSVSRDALSVLDDALDDFPTRMQTHADHARAIAEYLAANEMVDGVSYPGLASHPDHETAAGALQHGFGPAVEFELPSSVEARTFIAACPDAFRTSPAGGAQARVSAIDGPEGHTIRLFAGTQNVYADIDAIDSALRHLVR